MSKTVKTIILTGADNNEAEAAVEAPEASNGFAWSVFQAAIFAAVVGILSRRRDLVVLARAGTGKTVTMVEAMIRFVAANPGKRVLTCAFNRKNAVELQSRLDAAGLDWKQAQAKTLNSVGLATVKRAFGKQVRVDGGKGRKIAKAVVKQHGKKSKIQALASKVCKLAGLAKITLVPGNDIRALEDLCLDFGIVDETAEIALVCSLAGKAMAEAKADRQVVDFDDQLWFPHIFDLRPWAVDLVVVDEAQDLNASQLELARKCVKNNGRLVAVGDDRQAIYGWRGADSGFLSRMVSQLGAETLPLPRTYRCGKAIVAEAQSIVPDYEAADGNVEGVVRSIPSGKLIGQVKRGDFVLSRTNAPLLGLCLDLLKLKVPASIQGRDIMGQLIGIVERSECSNTVCLMSFLDRYERDELAKLKQADAEDEIVDQLVDRIECLRALAPEHDTCEGLLAHLDEVFSDQDDDSRVTLSSVHRAKGLERDRVFLLSSTFRGNGGQEDNVRYVAITRAKTELIYVTE